MDHNTNFETFLFLSPNKLIISIYEKEKKFKLYSKEKVIENDGDKINFKLLDDFLKENIFEIEKKFQNFIEKINLIIESNDFLVIQVSLKKNNYGEKIAKDKIIHLLTEANKECKQTINGDKVIHMIIDNYIFDNKNYSFLPKELKCEFFSLDVKFICLSQELIDKLEKILKNYQITINKIHQSTYVKSFLNNDCRDFFKMSMQIIDGYNENEVSIVPKEPMNKGFFERFFNFFN